MEKTTLKEQMNLVGKATYVFVQVRDLHDTARICLDLNAQTFFDKHQAIVLDKNGKVTLSTSTTKIGRASRAWHVSVLDVIT